MVMEAWELGLPQPGTDGQVPVYRNGRLAAEIVPWVKGTDIASASSITPGIAANYFDITGTTTITGIAATRIGSVILLQFDDAMTLTHHATDLVLPTGANITTAAGDHAAFIEYASGDWRCLWYQRADGTALAGSASATAARHNQLINGCFRNWQRGTSFASPSDGAYCADRWQVLSSGEVTFARSTDAPDGALYSGQFTVTATGAKFGIWQPLEQKDIVLAYDGANGTVSLGVDLKITGSSIGTVKAVVLAWTSTVDAPPHPVSAWGADAVTPTWTASYTAENTPANLNVTTSWVRYTIEGISLDTASTKNLGVFVWCDDASKTASDTLLIANVQLEMGSTATDFEFRHTSTEQLLCRRYCQSVLSDAATTFAVVGTGHASATTLGRANIPLIPEMFSIPSLTATATDWMFQTTTTFNVTALAIGSAICTTKVAALQATTSGMTAGHGGRLISDGTAGRLLILEAEL